MERASSGLSPHLTISLLETFRGFLPLTDSWLRRCSRPNPPFAELARLSPMSIVDEIREQHGRRSRNP